MADLRRPDPREEKKPDATRQEKVAAFLATAFRRFRASADFFSSLRSKQLEDKKMRAGEQWPDDIKNDRALDKRPCLTVNRFPQVLGQIADSQRESRPAIQINPVDGNDVDTAEVFQGVIRNIETQSDAETVYETGCNDQRVMGLGYWRVLTEYADDDGFDQELRLRRVRNAFSVYPDPTCQEATFEDARFYFITQDVPRDEYIDQWPDSELAGADDLQSIGDNIRDWVTEKAIRVAEYWYVEEKVSTISLIELPAFTNPQTGEQVPMQRVIVPVGDERIKGAKVLQSREVRRRQVKWAKINAREILEGNDDLTAGQDRPGRYIPIVPILGDEIDIDGKVDYRGVVRDAQDMQRLYNYQTSALVETVALAPKSPYIGAEGQFEGHEQEWETANVRNWSRLEYKPVTLGGQMAPPPQRQTFEPPIQAIVISIQQADNDIKSTTRYNDPSLGQPGPQESGVAIMARQRQDQKGSSSYVSNFARAVRFTGVILVDLIPHVYDAPRVMRIIGKDDQPKLVMLHAGQPPAESAEDLQRQRGIAGVYDVQAGKYDVTASVGPSYESRRQESVTMMSTAIEKAPQLLPLIGDLVFKNMDAPGSQEVSERLKKMLPPQLQEEKPGEPSIPPQVQQQMQMAQQQIQQLTQQLQQAQMIQQTEAQKLAAQGQMKQMELASQERMEQARLQYEAQCDQIKAQTELAKIQAQAAADERLARLQAQLEEMQARMEFQRQTVAARHQAAIDVATAHATAPMMAIEVEDNGNSKE